MKQKSSAASGLLETDGAADTTTREQSQNIRGPPDCGAHCDASHQLQTDLRAEGSNTWPEALATARAPHEAGAALARSRQHWPLPIVYGAAVALSALAASSRAFRCSASFASLVSRFFAICDFLSSGSASISSCVKFGPPYSGDSTPV